MIFTQENIRKINSGDKTMTRRVLKKQPTGGLRDREKYLKLNSPYKVGQLVGIKEVHYFTKSGNPSPQVMLEDGSVYTPKGFLQRIEGRKPDLESGTWKRRSPFYLPNWAIKNYIEIVNVKLEKLDEISDGDIKKEGVQKLGGYKDDTYPNFIDARFVKYSPKTSFKSLWESIHGKNSWGKNPWVWVIEFRKINK